MPVTQVSFIGVAKGLKPLLVWGTFKSPGHLDVPMPGGILPEVWVWDWAHFLADRVAQGVWIPPDCLPGG